MKFKVVSILLVFLFCFTSVSFAKSKIKDYDFGVGIGIPYGGIGANVEVGKGAVFTAGLGVMPFTDASTRNTQIGWSTGLKYYFKKEISSGIKLRASLLYGTVAYTQKDYVNTTTGGNVKEYELKTGIAPGIGVRGQNWDFDISYPIGYEIPDGVMLRGGKIKLSFGFRF